MYKKQQQGWLKHLDFIALDAIVLQISFSIAYLYLSTDASPYASRLYREMGFYLLMFSFCVSIMAKPHKRVLVRGYLKEAFSAFWTVSLTVLCQVVFMFVVQTSDMYSRGVVLLLWGVGTSCVYVARVLYKQILKKYMQHSARRRSVVVLAARENIVQVIAQLEESVFKQFRIVGAIVIDGEKMDEALQLGEIEVLRTKDETISFLTSNVVDELFIDLPKTYDVPEAFVEICRQAGITTHLAVMQRKDTVGSQSLELFGDYLVLTNSIRVITPFDAVMKRFIDICGALVGLCITGVIALCIGPAIKRASPGPIVFSQTRIGRNGRPFKFYKFRSMYLDAEERKAELENQNKMDGLMFKVDDDPRVLPGIGEYIRKSSLDEFPQFWNVLRGDMSLVGTRPPTEEEYTHYELNHKSRLAFKPGITGLWQVSGRSDIVKFEEVIRLDKQYISNWSLEEDIRILGQTVLAVIRRQGSI